jgi:hypothetical protein
MTIRVELFGIPRQRCGTRCVELETSGMPLALTQVLQRLASLYPEFARDCLDQTHLRPQYLANLGGSRFVSDPRVEIAPGESLLIMSADAGG